MHFRKNNNTIFQEIETMSFLLVGRFIMFFLKEPNLFCFLVSTQVSGPTHRLEEVINSSVFVVNSVTWSGYT